MSKARDLADIASDDVIATTATGVDVTGTVTADGLTVDTGSTFALSATFGHTGGSQLFLINDDNGTRNQIDSQKNSASADLDLATGGTKRIKVASNGDVSFYEDTGTTPKFYWDASAESLGIGTTTPQAFLHCGPTSGLTPQIMLGGTSAYRLDIGYSNSYEYGFLQAYGANTSTYKDIVMNYNGGNVIVGSDYYQGSSTAGASSAYIASNGFISANVTDDYGMQVNRTGTDGALVNFRKNGANVGSIGYISSGLYIDGEAGHSGLRFGGADITPRDGGADADAAIQLGQSGARFTDLYLSGGLRGDTLAFSTLAGAERMRITSSGNVGIGTSSPAFISGGGLHVHNSTVARVKVTNTTTGSASTDGSEIQAFEDDLYLVNREAAGKIVLSTNGADRVTIDASGNVLVGTGNNPTNARIISDAGSNVVSASFYAANPTYGMTTTFNYGTTRIGEIGSHGSIQGGASLTDFAINSPYNLVFTTGYTERMRIDSNGNVLVGTTSSAFSLEGHVFRAGDYASHTVDGDVVMLLNRTTSDGGIMQFRKDGALVGSIGVGGSSAQPIIGSGNTGSGGTAAGLRFDRANNAIQPWNVVTNAAADNIIDLGFSSIRFDDVYATNGTIQTSDRNEKEAIASLTPTEMLVAARLSCCFKNFKWRDAVAEKGDAARMHSGIIAQDVQDAFTAEGLDASDYAMFISSTWWETQTEVPAVEAVAEVVDEEGNVVTEAVEAKDAYTRTDTYDTLEEAPEGATERTRLGVRYPELLAFVAAYNDQRFLAIEARLTALEGTV